MARLKYSWLGLMLLVFGSQAWAEPLPSSLLTPLIVRVLSYEATLANSESVSIYVLNAPEFAVELRKMIGRSVGKAKLERVDSGSDLPTTRYSAIYVNDASRIAEVLNYSRGQKVLSISGNPDLIGKGVAICIDSKGGRPQFTLNLTATKEENLAWDPLLTRNAVIQR